MQDLLPLLGNRLAPRGLDLLAPLAVGWYNAAVPDEFHLPCAEDRLAVVVGNTRALWPRFLAAYRTRPDLAASPDPLDLYVEGFLWEALEGLPEVLDLRFAHEPPPRRVAIQRAAELAGLAWLSPAHLSVHPRYGPWIALRALVVFDLSGPEGPPKLAPPCADCRGSCQMALQKALQAGWNPAGDQSLWIAVREACARGRRSRYPEDAVRYHYYHDRSVLPRPRRS